MTQLSFALLFSIGCVSNEAPQSVPASAEIVVRHFTRAADAVITVAAPISSASEGGEGGDDATSQTAIASDLEDAGCVSLQWTGLSAVVDFDQCITADGRAIDGGLTVGLTLIPLRAFVAFDELAVDATFYDGDLGLAIAGPPDDRRITLDADVRFESDEDVSLELDSAALRITSGTATIDGAGTVTTPTLAAAATATAVRWTGDCLPTSGTLRYDDGEVSPLIRFLPTTPTDGVVEVSIGSFSTQVALLAPCL